MVSGYWVLARANEKYRFWWVLRTIFCVNMRYSLWAIWLTDAILSCIYIHIMNFSYFCLRIRRFHCLNRLNSIALVETVLLYWWNSKYSVASAQKMVQFLPNWSELEMVGWLKLFNGTYIYILSSIYKSIQEIFLNVLCVHEWLLKMAVNSLLAYSLMFFFLIYFNR